MEYRNFVQSDKGGRLHMPLSGAWATPTCNARAELWNIYGLTADEFEEQLRRWHVCYDCRELNREYFETRQSRRREWV